MKKLQSNFTTPEQSKRLIELGVPVNSADMGIIYDILNFGIEILVVPYDKWCKGYESISMPCWSVGRLIEIYKIVGEEAGQCISCSTNQSQVESLVQLYEENIEFLEFSKLEE